MNIQHMKYAVEVEKTGSISQAAENLYMGQPNLSKAIKELETSLGINIFRRTSKGVIPTASGEEFLGYAKNILAQIEEIESVYRPKDENKLSFRISVPRCSYITKAFTSFIAGLDSQKEIEVDFRETNSMRAMKNISEEGFHIGIIRYQLLYETYFLRFLADRGLVAKDVWAFQQIILMSAQSPLAQKQKLSPADLSEYIEIKHGDLSSVPNLSNTRKKGTESDYVRKRIHVYERGSQFDLLSRVHNTYQWASPLPEDILKRNNLVQRLCPLDNRTFKDVLIHPKNYKLKKIDKDFLLLIDDVIKDLEKVINP